MKFTKLLIVVMIILSLIGLNTIFAFAKADIKLVLNGEICDLEEYEPYIDSNDRTMISVRWVANQLNYDVDWNYNKRIAYIENSDIKVYIEAGNNKIYAPNKIVEMDTIAVIKNDRLFIPIRFLAECFSLKVKWNADTNTIYLFNPSKVLYDDTESKLGILIPQGFNKTDYKVEKNNYGQYSAISIYDSNTNGGLCTFFNFDIQYWNNEVKNDFPLIYYEVYKNESSIVFYALPSDVQYDPSNIQEKESYEKIFKSVEDICNSIYFYTN